MAKAIFVLYAVLLVLFVISEIDAAAPKTCEKPSKMYSGKCDNKKCDQKCKGWEKMEHGACHKREGKDACFCYYDCSKGGKSKGGKSPPAKGDSPPPPASSSPPPPAGGSPPPAEGGSPPPAEGGGSPPPAEGGGSPPPPAEGGGSPPPAEGGGSPPPGSF